MKGDRNNFIDFSKESVYTKKNTFQEVFYGR